jgi:lipopolysaccharide/colanic/teichoic acid biosynthesis glycosyltransferase
VTDVVDLQAERQARAAPEGGPPSPFALVCSVVSGSVIDRLATHLASQRGEGSEVCAAMEPQQWRASTRGGRASRLRARATAFGRFPLRLLRDAAERAPRALVVTTNPFTLPWVALATRPLHGRPVVPLIYDLYPDALEAAGLAKPTDLSARAIAAVNGWMLRAADGVVFIGDRMAASARERYGEPRAWTVIETGADPEEFGDAALGDDSPGSELERWMEGGLVASYVGNLGHVHDWTTLAAAIREARGLKVVLAASGPGAAFLDRELGDLEHVRVVEPLDDRAWARLLRRTDIALVSLKEAARATSIPSKTFSALAAGCAIWAVVPRDSDVADIIQELDAGVVVEPGQDDAAAASLRAMAEDEARLRAQQANARRAGARRYALSELGRRFGRFVEEVARDTDHGARLKRSLDVVGAATGLVVFGPLLAASAAAVAVDLGRPVFFVQPRAGRDGRTFKLIKLRSMRDAKPGQEGSEHDHLRVTALGRFLRASSLDELPTLVNVLRGEMSLVGPRPLLVRYVDRYSTWQRRRLEAKPGVTGWAQVNGRNALGWDEKFAHDVWYVEHGSVWLDLKILARTVGQVLRRNDISQDGHVSMPEFMGDEAEGAASA